MTSLDYLVDEFTSNYGSPEQQLPCTPDVLALQSPVLSGSPNDSYGWFGTVADIDVETECGLNVSGSNFEHFQKKASGVVALKEVTQQDILVEEERREKNRLSAKESRRKKKIQTEGLRDDYRQLQESHSKLGERASKLEDENAALREQVRYLNSVLKHSSVLSDLLTDIRPRVESRKRQRDESTDGSASICLTVRSDGDVSLEMCATCSTGQDNCESRPTKRVRQ